MDWKPESVVHAKIRDIKKMIILIGQKPERAIYAKVKDLWQVTASEQAINHVGHLSCQKFSEEKHLSSGIQSC